MITLLTTRRKVFAVQISILLAVVATAAPVSGGPIGTLEELSPTPLSFVQDVDFSTFEGPAFFGAATGVLEAVELGTTSGCEASDFSAFTSGNIALIKRTFGACACAGCLPDAEPGAGAHAGAAARVGSGRLADRKGRLDRRRRDQASSCDSSRRHALGEGPAPGTKAPDDFIRRS